jgi:hypothetical protein
MCNNWPDFPISVLGATGGLIGDTVIICGGYASSSVDDCYSLTSEKSTLVTHMSYGRRFAASIVINDNTLWVTGGLSDVCMYNVCGWSLVSSEYVTVTGTMLGPDLPTSRFHHAMVAINSTCSMVIGGYSQGYVIISYGSTFYYDHNEGEWVNGPSLMQKRNGHAAGIVTDEVTGEHFVAVTGGHDSNFDELNSTEILQDGEWVQGRMNYMLSLGIFLVSKY